MSGGGPWSPPGFDLGTPAWGCNGGGCRWPCGPEGFNSGGGWPGMPTRNRTIIVSCGVNSLLWSLHFDRCELSFTEIYVVVQFCPWFKFYFFLFLGRVMYDDEFETMKNNITPRIKLKNNIYDSCKKLMHSPIFRTMRMHSHWSVMVVGQSTF